jgi:hypothetical protein
MTMKKLYVTALLLMITACTPAEKHEGMTTYSGRTFESLQHTGNLELKEVKVTEGLSGSGKLTAEKTVIGSIMWKGPATFDQSSIFGTTNISGALKATKGLFKGDVTVTSDLVELLETEIDGTLDIKASRNGQTTLNQVTVENKVIGTGTLHLTKGRIGGLEWDGATTATECRVAEDAIFTGPLNLDSCIFKENVTATSTMIHLNDVQINGNLLIPETKGNSAQTVVLTGGSTIKGNVTFASGQGIITKDNDSTIQGKVIGAT